MPDEDVPPGSQYVQEPPNKDAYRVGKILAQVGSRDGRIELWINRREVTDSTLGKILTKLGAELSLGHLPKVNIFNTVDVPHTPERKESDSDEHSSSGD